MSDLAAFLKRSFGSYLAASGTTMTDDEWEGLARHAIAALGGERWCSPLCLSDGPLDHRSDCGWFVPQGDLPRECRRCGRMMADNLTHSCNGPEQSVAKFVAALGGEWFCREQRLRTGNDCTPDKPHVPHPMDRPHYRCHWAIPRGDTDE